MAGAALCNQACVPAFVRGVCTPAGPKSLPQGGRDRDQLHSFPEGQYCGGLGGPTCSLIYVDPPTQMRHKLFHPGLYLHHDTTRCPGPVRPYPGPSSACLGLLEVVVLEKRERPTPPPQQCLLVGPCILTQTHPDCDWQTPTPTPAAERSPLFRAGSPEGESSMCQEQAPSPAVGNQDFRPYLKGRAEPPSSLLPAETASENSETETYLQ